MQMKIYVVYNWRMKYLDKSLKIHEMSEQAGVLFSIWYSHFIIKSSFFSFPILHRALEIAGL